MMKKKNTNIFEKEKKPGNTSCVCVCVVLLLDKQHENVPSYIILISRDDVDGVCDCVVGCIIVTM